ncbi:MAG: nucleotide exchange factor GrpE [Limnobacter sp.]|nr:nucleotide exchange factor GrpE [Limnobacter sp.]
MSDPNAQNGAEIPTPQPGQQSEAESNAAKYQKVQDQAPLASQDAEANEASNTNEANAPGETEPSAAEQELATALQAALEEAEKHKETMLRLAAELENTRRRTVEDVAKAHKFAIEGFAQALLPVRDALETALSLDNQTIETLKEGVTATLRQLETAFEKSRIVTINPEGEKFDPNQQQAVSMVPGNSVNPTVAPNHVVTVLQKGYLLHERVLRPALVAVAS